MGDLVLGVFRSSAPQPLDPGEERTYWGDSQTAGRATGTTASHAIAFETILATKGYTGDSYINGESGRSLPGTVSAYNGRAERLTATMVWVQESGNQNFAGQATVADYKATIIAFFIAAAGNTPNALFVLETSFSFGREAEGFPRNWDDWNTALREAVAELLSEYGITVIIVETDAAIKALQALLTPGDVWFQAGHADEYHYDGLGNCMVAVAGFKAMRIPLTLADLADIAELDNTEKQLCLDVYDELP